MFGAAGDLRLLGYRHNLAEALDGLRTVQPDVILIDQGPGLKAVLQFISDLKAIAPMSRSVLWAHELAEVECFRALQLGARGAIRKILPVSTLVECLRAVAGGTVWVENSLNQQQDVFSGRRGTPRLTPREKEIVQHVCRGLKNREIADTLAITAGTVKVHLMHIFEKTGVKDRFELAIQGRRLSGDDRS